ncbi:HAD-IA family hydrolase [Nisaea sp.]|uniref:HAD-IA family hydrolase n=1 Tax=Nisaea sp. TaxID=2024842 RepID=UPI0032987866
MRDICVIFDLDGTLVDSEALCNQAFIDLLPALDCPVEVLIQRYRGKKLSTILADIERQTGKILPNTFEAEYRKRVAELFARTLKPIPGVIEMLDRLSHSKCIASSGPPEKIRQALEVSGLASYFEHRIFSSYDIGCWKPDPGLFLHAAREMGFEPGQCVVVEDSEVGIQAAIAAEMEAFHFMPPNSSASLHEGTVFHEMSQLTELLAAVSA